LAVGGAPDSVRNALRTVDSSYDIVLIHDGARPFVDNDIIAGAVEAAKEVRGVRNRCPRDRYGEINVTKGMFVKKELDRSKVFRAQTPQAFRRELIQRAYRQKAGKAATDDSALVRMLGHKVKVLMGSYRNVKITRRDDLKQAEVLI